MANLEIIDMLCEINSRLRLSCKQECTEIEQANHSGRGAEKLIPRKRAL